MSTNAIGVATAARSQGESLAAHVIFRLATIGQLIGDVFAPQKCHSNDLVVAVETLI